VDRLKQEPTDKSAKPPIDRLPGREIIRQHPPSPARTRHITDRVQHLPQLDLDRAPRLRGARKKRLNPRPLLVGQVARIPLGLLLDLGHSAARRWGPHPKLESRPKNAFNQFSNGLLKRCRSSRSREGSTPGVVREWRKSASMAIRLAVSGRLVLPGTLPRIALTTDRQVRIASAPTGQHPASCGCGKLITIDTKAEISWWACDRPQREARRQCDRDHRGSRGDFLDCYSRALQPVSSKSSINSRRQACFNWRKLTIRY
jgi:hypothetical protein